MKVIDLIIPLYNESDSVPLLMERLKKVFSVQSAYSFNFIFINDGSTDDTYKKLNQLCSDFPFTSKVISLSRNFGHQSAMGAGLKVSTGDAAIVLDGDLQDPPELVFQMLKHWETGSKVVYAKRTRRQGESFFKIFSAVIFYKILRGAANVDIPADTGDFRLTDKAVVKALNDLPERNRFVRGLVPWLGFSQSFVEFERPMRLLGETKYPFSKMLKLAVDGISSFSTLPIRLCTYLGIAVIFSSGVLACKIAYDTFTHPSYSVNGWASVIVAIIFFGGIQLLFLGIIGEYVGRVFDEVKGRPNFIIDEVKDYPRS